MQLSRESPRDTSQICKEKRGSATPATPSFTVSTSRVLGAGSQRRHCMTGPPAFTWYGIYYVRFVI